MNWPQAFAIVGTIWGVLGSVVAIVWIVAKQSDD
jgi:hypothetical protein